LKRCCSRRTRRAKRHVARSLIDLAHQANSIGNSHKDTLIVLDIWHRSCALLSILEPFSQIRLDAYLELSYILWHASETICLLASVTACDQFLDAKIAAQDQERQRLRRSTCRQH
jgi:hypothetical protein